MGWMSRSNETSLLNATTGKAVIITGKNKRSSWSVGKQQGIVIARMHEWR